MWNPFKRRTQATSPSPDPSRNRVDELADSLYGRGKIGELEPALEKMDKSTLSKAELESWWHAYGILALQSNREELATKRFEEAYRACPESASIRFSLGQQYLEARQVDRGFELFRSCAFPEVSREMAFAQIRYAYLWSRYDDGLAMLRPFIAIYERLGVLDSHFLYTRGLPFFGMWWSCFAALSVLAGNNEELESVTEHLSRRCSDHDFERTMTLEWPALRDGEPAILLPSIEASLNSAHASGPTGYLALQRAVVAGRSASSSQEAVAQLRQVDLGANDPPWLENIELLVKAEIAHRYSQIDIEKEFISAFMSRQPLLLEPDHAVNFHLLRYQERLKALYQAG